MNQMIFDGETFGLIVEANQVVVIETQEGFAANFNSKDAPTVRVLVKRWNTDYQRFKDAVSVFVSTLA